MLHRHHTTTARWWRGRNTALLALIACLWVMTWLTTTARAAATVMVMDEAIARQVYTVAENWVGRFRLPDQVTPIAVTDLTSVHVTIRRGGATVGQGSAAIEDPAHPPAVGVDVMALARQAVGDALRSAVGAFNSPAQLMEQAHELTLDIQFAGPVLPVKVTQLADLPDQIVTSRDGLALQHGTAWSWCPPGNAVASNTNLQGQLNRLLAGVNLPVDQIQRVGSPDGPSLHRFDTIHLVRPTPGEPIVSLQRGSVVLPPVVVSGSMLLTISQQLASHLIARQLDDGRFAGTYEPTSGRYSIPIAGTPDTTLCAYVLARAARVPGLTDEQRQPLQTASLKALRAALDAMNDSVEDPADRLPQLVPTATTLLAILQAPGAGELKNERALLTDDLLNMQQASGLFHLAAGSAGRLAPLSGQSVAAAALASLFDRTRDPRIAEAARRALTSIWPKVADDEKQAVFAMPFLAIAEVTLARAGAPTGNLVRFKPLADAMWARQITPWGDAKRSAAAPDEVGGFTWGGEPTWQSAQVLAGLAVLLTEPDAVPQEQRMDRLAAAGIGARFLAQLTIQTPGAYYIHRPGEAVGGVRLSLSDNRQPLFATATALLAIAELQHAAALLSR
jgi:rhamnogalacturonyl hydrolase YesR